MAYHQDFWLLVGVASPLMVVAHAVSLAPGRRPTTEVLRIAASMPDGVAKRRAGGLAWSPWLLAAIGVVVSAVAFSLALASAAGHDDHGVNAALWCLIMSAAVWLFAALIDAMAAKFLAEQRVSI